MKHSLFKMATVIGFILHFGICAPFASDYIVTDLGTLQGTGASWARAINESGQVVGRSNYGNGTRAFIWDSQNGMRPLPTLGGLHSEALDINDTGQVVGYSYPASSFAPVIWPNNDTIQNLSSFWTGGCLSGYAYGINNSGQVVGQISDCGGTYAFLWNYPGNMTKLEGLFNGPAATAINNGGKILGHGYLNEFNATVQSAVVWETGNAMQILDQGINIPAFYQIAQNYGLGGDPNYWARYTEDINDSGVAVGELDGAGAVFAVLWDGTGGMRDLGNLGSLYSYAYAINDQGKVVGYSTLSDAFGGAQHAFLWDSNLGMIDLNSLIDSSSGWVLIEAYDINNSGQIVGYGTINGQVRAFLATPSAMFPQHSLTVTKSGTGLGNVTSNPGSIVCGTTCSEDFNSGTLVTLTATPDSGSTFGGWQGCDSTSPNQCMVTMSAARAVTATFQECSYSITPTNATVTAAGSTETITVMASSRDCAGSWTAQSNDGWITITTASSGAGNGSVGYAVSENQTDLERNGTITVAGQTFTVTQMPQNLHTLSISVAGQGTISSDPAGIDCGADCTEPYVHGSAITLTPSPSENYRFDGWSGGGCTGTDPCTVTLTSDTMVTASFSITNRIVKLAPQVLMAGFDPILLDLTTTRVRIMALVTEGNQSISAVTITDNSGSLSFAMNLMGRLSNGDLLYGAELSLDRGPDFSVPNLFGSGSGQILIKAIDTLGLSHSFPTVIYGDNRSLTSTQSGTETPLFTQQGCKRLLPQVLMAGLEPALLDYDDSELKIRAIVRQGVRPIRDVSLRTNDGALNLVMDFVEALPNGDMLYEKTVVFPRGSFGQYEVRFENLWGSMSNQFIIQVRDDAGQTHSFPDLRRGDYRTINPTECWSDQ